MFLLPVGFLLYLIVSLADRIHAEGMASSFMTLSLAIGVPAALLMSAAAFVLMYRSVRPIEKAARNAEEFFTRIHGTSYKPAHGDEAEKISSYLSDMIGELKHKLNDVDAYAQQLREANQKLLELAVNDGLTGLYNRKQVDHVLAVEVDRATRFGHPLCVLMMDLDRFKDFNDTYGHLAGDNALRKIGQIFKESVRRVDVSARYGGEEFLVVLPETDVTEAGKIGERIRASVANTVFDTGRSPKPGRLTISIGVATYGRGETALDLVGRADASLYQAKQTGRNKVCA
jgi:diguanylate cyclase (GGDEF)-like protein